MATMRPKCSLWLDQLVQRGHLVPDQSGQRSQRSHCCCEPSNVNQPSFPAANSLWRGPDGREGGRARVRQGRGQGAENWMGQR